VDNAWRHLEFGGCPYGIHGCVPGEIVHALQLGVMTMTVDGLFFTKALKAETRNINRKEKKLQLKAASDKEKRGWRSWKKRTWRLQVMRKIIR
jgi:hypothetical protein